MDRRDSPMSRTLRLGDSGKGQRRGPAAPGGTGSFLRGLQPRLVWTLVRANVLWNGWCRCAGRAVRPRFVDGGAPGPGGRCRGRRLRVRDRADAVSVRTGRAVVRRRPMRDRLRGVSGSTRRVRGALRRRLCRMPQSASMRTRVRRELCGVRRLARHLRCGVHGELRGVRRPMHGMSDRNPPLPRRLRVRSGQRPGGRMSVGLRSVPESSARYRNLLGRRNLRHPLRGSIRRLGRRVRLPLRAARMRRRLRVGNRPGLGLRGGDVLAVLAAERYRGLCSRGLRGGVVRAGLGGLQRRGWRWL